MSIKAVLFDLDGTLVDTLRIFPQLIAQRYIKNPTPSKIRAYLRRLGYFYNLKDKFSWFHLDFFRGVQADFKLNWFTFLTGMLQITIQFYRWDSDKHPFPQVEKTLKLLKKEGYLLGLVSNGSPKLLRKRFDPYLSYFDIIIDSKTLGIKKPSPIPLLVAAARLNLNVNQIAFVGDTLVDLLAAKNAKVKNLILVRSGVFGLPAIKKIDYKPIAIIPVVDQSLLDIIGQI